MLQQLRNGIAKIGSGLLYGIGFAVVAGPTYYFISVRMMDSVWNEAALQKVSITKHEEVKRGNGVYVLGTVENNGSETTRTLVIQVDLLDKNGQFVGQCSEYLQGALKPHEPRNFQVSCGGRKEDVPVVEHQSYKVYVVGM